MRLFSQIKIGVARLCLLVPLFTCGHSLAAMTANFDTAWTFTYDGGLATGGRAIPDIFHDVKVLPNGNAICVGETRDSTFDNSALIFELSPSGQVTQKKILWLLEGIGASSILIARNHEYFVGGYGFNSPELLRLDSQFNIKSSTWYFDTANNRSRLLHRATLQSMVQTSDGRIIAVGGDDFPYNNGSSLNNYAVWMEFDSLGVLKSDVREWSDSPGFEIAGWSLLETASGGFLMGGNQSIGIITSDGDRAGFQKYTFSLKGVGTETNKVSRVRKLRNGKLIVVGQAYEEDCWTKYQRLSYDGWWSFISEGGSNDSWNTVGISGSGDALFDVTQLTDNRIAFLGIKGTVPDSGLWVFVTDSTAKTIQWEKQFDLPKIVGASARNNLVPYSLEATPDSGFIVVGKENSSKQAENAFAAKFVPKPMPTSNLPFNRVKNEIIGATKNSLSFEATRPGIAEFKVYDLNGHMVQTEKKVVGVPGRVTFDFQRAGHKNDLVLWEIRTPNQYLIGKYFLNGKMD